MAFFNLVRIYSHFFATFESIFWLNNFFLIQVIADQSVWAVCGRQGAVLNMENNKKQSIIVEVMPLIGGQLALPSVRLSKVGSLKITHWNWFLTADIPF